MLMYRNASRRFDLVISAQQSFKTRAGKNESDVLWSPFAELQVPGYSKEHQSLGTGRATVRTLTVQGLHFKAAERVTVTVYSHGAKVRRTRATSAGSFSVEFPDVQMGRCGV